MNNLTFRAAKATDLPTLLEFEQGIIEAERPFAPDLKAEKFSYYDISEMITATDVAVIVGEEPGELICSGYVRIKAASSFQKYEKYAYLGFMYVRPSHRGKGVNQLLVNELLNWAKSQNVHDIHLTVYSDNHSAVRAYEKAGFKNVLTEMRLKIDKYEG